MALITLNGVPVNVDLNKGIARSDIEIGPGLYAAYDGTAQRERIGFKREWKLSYWVDSQYNAAALRNLLNSVTVPGSSGSDHYQIDNGPQHYAVATAVYYSDKGYNGIALSGAAAVAFAGGKFTNVGSVGLSTNTSIVQFDTNGSLTTTGGIFGCWHVDSGTYHQYVVAVGVSPAVIFVYKDGVAQANTLPTWLAINAGYFQVTGSGTSTDAVSDIWFYPFQPGDPTTWATGLSAQALTGQWPNACYLALAGSLGTANVVCASASTTVVPSALPGAAFSETNERLDFVLRET